jgi:hypothetical protein
LNAVALSVRAAGKGIRIDAAERRQDVHPDPTTIVSIIKIVGLSPGAGLGKGQQYGCADRDQTGKKTGTKRVDGGIHRGGSGLEFVHLDLFVFVGNFLSP